MVITIILSVLLGISLLILGWLIIRKLPQLKVVEPSSAKEAKTKELKQDILRQRLSRAAAGPLSSATSTALTPFRYFQGFVRGAAAKLRELERSYAEKEKGKKVKLEDADIRLILDDAHTYMEEEKYEEAEKKLIELISIDPKKVEAYELLGRLYMVMKDFLNAKETFAHVLKLAPKDASILASLGEIADLEGDEKKSYEYFRKAKELSPNNPKYLDFYIQAAIENADFYEAEQALQKLEQVNPENQKIPLLAARIKEAREKR